MQYLVRLLSEKNFWVRFYSQN